jgi:DNA repair protein RadC
MDSQPPPRTYIRLRDRPPEEQPRERLLKHGAESLSAADLLAILIRVGKRGRSAIQVAEELIESQPDGLKSIDGLSVKELTRISGIGPTKAITIKAALALARRIQDAPEPKRIYLETIEDVAEHFRKTYGAGAPEKFVAFFINKRHRLLHEKEIARGSGNAVVVDPKVIFKEAVLCDARAIILAHNHPGESLEPSKQDLDLTKRLEEAGKLFSIPIVEHVIVTADGEAGLMKNGD